MDEPLVSVVIPAFNAESTIVAALASVPSEGWPPVEIIVVDDASTDRTGAVVGDYVARTRRPTTLVRLSQNAGSAAARNTGLRRARGAFVGFLDADDRYAPTFLLDILAAFLREPEMALVSCGIALVDCAREAHPLQMTAVVRSSPCNLLVRREAAELVGGFPEDPAFRGPLGGEDVAFREALRKHFAERHLARELYLYTIRPGNHLDQFLARSEVRDGKLVFEVTGDDRQSGALQAARRHHLAAVRRRIVAARQLAKLP